MSNLPGTEGMALVTIEVSFSLTSGGLHLGRPGHGFMSVSPFVHVWPRPLESDGMILTPDVRVLEEVQTQPITIMVHQELPDYHL